MLALLAGLSTGVGNVCDSTRQMYRDTACCAGVGHSYCSSEVIDLSSLDSKLDQLITASANTGSTPVLQPVHPCKQSATTLGELCHCPLLEDTNTPKVWPPSNIESGKFVSSDGYPSYGTIAASEHPHAGSSLPPYFGLCTSASQIAAQIFQTCGVSDYADYIVKTSNEAEYAAMTTANAACPGGMKMMMMYTIVLQFEYLIASGSIEIGSTYYDSLAEEIVLPGQLGTIALSTPAYTQYAMQWADGNPMVATSIQNFQGHSAVVRDDTIRTSYSTDTVPLMQDGIYSGYPQHFDICLASRVMFDYLVQVPAELFPEKYAVFTLPTRCTSHGMTNLKIQSLILGWEKMVVAANSSTTEGSQILVNTCPSVATLSDLAWQGSVSLKVVSPDLGGRSCTLETCADAAGPSTNDAYYLHRDDALHARTLWLTFLHVHVKALQTACRSTIGSDYMVPDPFGRAPLVHLTVDDLFTLRTEYEQAYPRTLPIPTEDSASLSQPAPTVTMKQWADVASPLEKNCASNDAGGRFRDTLRIPLIYDPAIPETHEANPANLLDMFAPNIAQMFGVSVSEAKCYFCATNPASIQMTLVDPDVSILVSDILPGVCHSACGTTSTTCP